MQIYDDKGDALKLKMGFDLRRFVNIVSLNSTKDSGKFHTKVYNVNLNSNLEENPDFFRYALGTHLVLKGNNFELLEAIQKPFDIEGRFSDSELVS